MKHAVAWVCAVIATLLAFAVLYWFGISILTVLLAILLLSCPIVVVWVSWRLSRQCERDIQQAVERERKARGSH